MPIALSKLKATYDLKDVENKQFFPHYFNKELNYGSALETLAVNKVDAFMKDT